ncbi:MAG: Gldg family protein [Gemmatales bacterium]|nr:Gldg family protein [Gemmatales bacterium]
MSEGANGPTQQRPWRPALIGMLAAASVAVVAVIWLAVRVYQAGQNQEPRYPYVPYLVFAIASALISGMTATFLWLAYRREESLPTLSSLERANLLGWLALQAFMVAVILGVMPVVLEYNLEVLGNWFQQLSKGLPAWREWATWRPIVFTLGGLFAMMLAFLGLVGEERDNPNLRRLIYGYNTFLSAVLLLGILVVINVMAFAYGTRPFDWSSTGIFTVHERMQRLIRQLPHPVDVYVLLDPRDDLYTEMRDYLEVCRTYNRDKFRVHYPFFGQVQETLGLLYKRYRVSADQSGVLVVYDPNGRDAYQFLRRDDLRSESRLGREPTVFKGEVALASAIVTLMQGPQKPIIYFTSGAGEMTPTHNNPERNLRRLQDRLEQQGYQVKVVNLVERDAFGGLSSSILQALMEADVWIVADPLSAPPGYLDVLKTYMGQPSPQGLPQVLAALHSSLSGGYALLNTATLDWFLVRQALRGKGRLVVFTGVELGNDGAPVAFPLADFLKEFGVQTGKDLLLSLARRGGVITAGEVLRPVVRISPQADKQLVAGLARPQLESAISLPLARSVESTPAGDYVVHSLLETLFPVYPLTEPLTDNDPLIHLLELVKRDPNAFQQRIRKPPHPVAVTVRERSERVPRDPFHAGVAGEGAPRLVVFGSSYLALAADDDFVFNLVASSVAWLRQRTELVEVGIPPRERKTFQPGPNFEQYGLTSYVLQGLLVFGLIIFSGVGVYLVRRR